MTKEMRVKGIAEVMEELMEKFGDKFTSEQYVSMAQSEIAAQTEMVNKIVEEKAKLEAAKITESNIAEEKIKKAVKKVKKIEEDKDELDLIDIATKKALSAGKTAAGIGIQLYDQYAEEVENALLYTGSIIENLAKEEVAKELKEAGKSAGWAIVFNAAGNFLDDYIPFAGEVGTGLAVVKGTQATYHAAKGIKKAVKVTDKQKKSLVERNNKIFEERMELLKKHTK